MNLDLECGVKVQRSCLTGSPPLLNSPSLTPLVLTVTHDIRPPHPVIQQSRRGNFLLVSGCDTVHRPFGLVGGVPGHTTWIPRFAYQRPPLPVPDEYLLGGAENTAHGTSLRPSRRVTSALSPRTSHQPEYSGGNFRPSSSSGPLVRGCLVP